MLELKVLRQQRDALDDQVGGGRGSGGVVWYGVEVWWGERSGQGGAGCGMVGWSGVERDVVVRAGRGGAGRGGAGR